MLQALHLGMLAAYFWTTLDIKIQIYWMGLLYHLLGYRLWIALRLTSKGLVAFKMTMKIAKRFWDSETETLRMRTKMAMKIASRCKACCSSQKVHFDSNHFDPPCNNKCSRKKMAASVGEKPTLSKPVMMMMVSTKLLLTSSIIIEELFYLLDKL